MRVLRVRAASALMSAGSNGFTGPKSPRRGRYSCPRALRNGPDLHIDRGGVFSGAAGGAGGGSWIFKFRRKMMLAGAAQHPRPVLDRRCSNPTAAAACVHLSLWFCRGDVRLHVNSAMAAAAFREPVNDATHTPASLATRFYFYFSEAKE